MTVRVDTRTRAQWDALAHELKAARSHRGDFSPQDLAGLLEVTPGSVVDWEAGRDTPTMFHLIRWAHALGLVLRVAEPGREPLRYQSSGLEICDGWDAGEMRELALALHAARLAAGSSQAEVAAELGVNRWSVSRWESGLGHPRPIGLLAWANALRRVVVLRPSSHDEHTR